MPDTQVMTPDQLLDSWQGHRRVTRRMIDAFPEKDLFTYSVGGMRPFGALAAFLFILLRGRGRQPEQP